MRTKALLILTLGLLLMPQVSLAAWTGIAAFAGQQESDWSLNGQAINADSRLYGLQAEERSRVGLHVGARVSQNSLRLESPLNTPTLEKYEVQQLAFYLRWPIPLNDTLTLHTRVDYQYNTGNRSKIDNDNDIDIDWIETTLETGLSLRMGLFSIRPFVNFSWINGEITTPASITKIELDDGHSAGVLVDIYVERTAFVRLKATASGSDSLFISFVREY